jgi:drug/metabolite transporter superfamily protein YnfA
MAEETTTKESRTWHILGGVLLLAVCGFFAMRSPAGRRYAAWRLSVA